MTSTVTSLPSIPAGLRWQIKHKRAWKYLTLQRQTWYGWKTIAKQSVNPSGMTVQAALVSCALDIIDSRSVAA
jgi:hypothetical protein